MRYTLDRFGSLHLLKPRLPVPTSRGRHFLFSRPTARFLLMVGRKFLQSAPFACTFSRMCPPTHPHIHAEQFANGRVGCEGSLSCAPLDHLLLDAQVLGDA